MANFLAKIFTGGAGTLIEAVGSAIDKVVTSDEERLELTNEIQKAEMAYTIEMRKLSVEEKRLVLADTGSARDHQSRVQESDHASWLSKNIHPVLAATIIGLTFFMYFWVVQKGSKGLADTGMKDVIIYILGALTALSTQVASYFFGSSQGSQDKQKAFNKMAKAL